MAFPLPQQAKEEFMGILVRIPNEISKAPPGSLTRARLAAAVRERTGWSKSKSADFVETVLTEMVDVIVSGEDVFLSSFGSFHVRSKKERLGRNPKTGVAAPISARRVVTFKPSQVLRSRVNGLRKSARER